MPESNPAVIREGAFCFGWTAGNPIAMPRQPLSRASPSVTNNRVLEYGEFPPLEARNKHDRVVMVNSCYHCIPRPIITAKEVLDLGSEDNHISRPPKVAP